MFNAVPPQPPFNGQAPLIGQRERAMKAGVMQAMQTLSFQIYSHLAIDHIRTVDFGHVEPAKLEALARDAETAAKAYFEGLGVAKFPRDDQEQET